MIDRKLLQENALKEMDVFFLNFQGLNKIALTIACITVHIYDMCYLWFYDAIEIAVYKLQLYNTCVRCHGKK